MEKTRNLFFLSGSEEHVAAVLQKLTFKGLVTVPCEETVTDSAIETAFKNNKSLVCSIKSYVGKNVTKAIHVKVVPRQEENSAPTIVTEGEDFAVQFQKIANHLGCDIGDHKSNSSGLNGAPSVKDCAYCRYLAGNPTDNERTVYRSKNFFIIPTVGQFIKGSLLVIPFKHIVSNAELAPELLDEFEEVVEDVEFLIKLTYQCPNVLVWENGTGNGGKGKAKDSIVHSHLHIYPSNLTTNEIEQMSGFEFETITLSELSKYTKYSYLLIRTPDHKIWKINNNPELYIPRQYVRQLVAEEHNIPGGEWNWRTNPFSRNMYDTVEDICVALKKNWSSLPERIRQNTSFLF